MSETVDPAGAVERPSSVRAFGIAAVVRIVVVGVVQVASVIAAPSIVDGYQDRLDQRLGLGGGRVQTVDPAITRFSETIGAVVGGVFALGFLVGWALFARSAYRGTRWGVVGTAILSGLNLLSVVTLPLLRVLGLDYPGWLLGLAALAVAVDAVVVTLLLLPASRAWYAAVRPPPATLSPAPGPGGPPPDWTPQPTGWTSPSPVATAGPPPLDAGFPSLPPAPHLDRPPPGWSPPDDGQPGRRH
ncbi:hypothetical protein ACXR2U_10035 [Jatrophihabitans sp. YIM 134969]